MTAQAIARLKERVSKHVPIKPEHSPKARHVKHPRVANHRELVGTALKTRIEGIVKVKSGKGCGCQTLANEMNSWGIAGCEKYRETIVAALVANGNMLAEALRTIEEPSLLQSTLHAFTLLAPDLISSAAYRLGANWLLDRAIEDVRNSPPPVIRSPDRRRRPTAAKMRADAAKFVSSLKREQARLFELNNQQPPPTPDPFTGEPVLHFGAHLWPVRGNWQWHVDLWNQMQRLVNGKCFVGIATDGGTDDFETVKAALRPEFICKQFPNTKEGENNTFRWLQEVVPQGHNDVLIYCHGKGVRAHTAQSKAVRLWTEAMYQTIVFNHQMIREQMEAGYKNCHSFRTFGKRPLSPVNLWHPSGTFFAVRAKYISGKPVKQRYGGVEAWCGDHFAAAESWCEFYDNSMFTTLYDAKASTEIVEPLLIEWNRKRRYEDEDMCSTWGRNFCRQLPEGSIKGKTVVEVGSVDVNGSCRPWIVSQLPASYLGTDMQEGPNVDVVCTGEELPEKIGRESCDLLICTEVLEHVEHWFEFVRSIWSTIKLSGILLLTTRSPGFPLHNYPSDHWRFTVRDMLTIFEYQEILTVTADPTTDPGVGVIIRKRDEALTAVNPQKAPS